MKTAQNLYRRILARGLRCRCPQCGVGELFRRWNHLRERCAHCGLEYEPLEGNSWWFMYYSTAIMTGVIVIAMLLFRPTNLWLGRLVVFGAALVVIVLSLPYRKGLALAIDYLSERRAALEPAQSESVVESSEDSNA